MVERYSREIMAKKWDMQAKYDAWLKVELAAVKAWNKLAIMNRWKKFLKMQNLILQE